MDRIPSFEWAIRDKNITINVFLPTPTPDSGIAIDVTTSHLTVTANREKVFDLDLSFKTDPDQLQWANKQDHIAVVLNNKSQEQIVSPIVAPLRIGHTHLADRTVTTFDENPPLQLESKTMFFEQVRPALISYTELFEQFSSKREQENFDNSDVSSIPGEERERMAEERYKQAVAHSGADLDGKFKLYKEGAALGHAKCRINAAKILQSKHASDPESVKKALDYYVAAAVENHSTAALFTLGQAYQNGNFGVTADLEQAKMFYITGAVAGDSNCMFSLGQLAEADEDLETAVAWWHLALNRGHAVASRNIGATTTDPSMALQYYNYAFQVDPESYPIPQGLIEAIQQQEEGDWEDEEEDEEGEEDAIFKNALRGIVPDENGEIDLEQVLNSLLAGGNGGFSMNQPQTSQPSGVSFEEVKEEEEIVVPKKAAAVTTTTTTASTITAPPVTSAQPVATITQQVSPAHRLTRNVAPAEPVEIVDNTPHVLWKVTEYALTAGIVCGVGYFVNMMALKSFTRK